MRRPIPDLSCTVVGLRAYAEGIQALCSAGDENVQLAAFSVYQLFEPVLAAMREMEAALQFEPDAAPKSRAYTANH